MLKLSGRIDPIHQRADTQSALLTITTDPFLPLPMRERFALLTDRPVDVAGYGSQLISDGLERSESPLPDAAIYRLPTHFNYLKSGDIVYLDGPRHFLNTLFPSVPTSLRPF